ncbi:ribosome-inactivating protein bryodin II-like [Hibiscus syriacus]|uniref:ribosome-inactivating protein bryodin II-like n=1 Tax=Hibiscus syriacus TaxID=106335 RepID=UPI0019241073|nr:ribosome-inactivating protein bryodin II-like [Hibiscus syriacus]
MKVAQTMKVLAMAIVWACFVSTVEPQAPIYKVTFTATSATKSTYDVFIKDMINSLIVHGSSVQGFPVLPPRTMSPTDLHRYVVVELTSSAKKVSLVIDSVTVYILGYRPGDGTASYWFKDVSAAVQNLFFQGTTRVNLGFDGSYDDLKTKAGGVDRDQIPLGFGELRQKIQSLNYYTPQADVKQVAKALVVCVQMVSEAARLKIIQQQIAALAPLVPGGPDKTLYPDGVMKAYETSWGKLSDAIQDAKPEGNFIKSVTVVTGQIVYSTVASVRPVISILQKQTSATYSATALLGQVFCCSSLYPSRVAQFVAVLSGLFLFVGWSMLGRGFDFLLYP